MGSQISPLLAEHEQAGASLTEFGGWMMPLRYGSDIAEHNAVRAAAGLFDISHMGQLHVVGAQAGAALDFALVGWLSALQVGRARYTMICQDDGAVIDDLVVYRIADDHFIVVANAGNTSAVLIALRQRVAGFDAAVTVPEEQVALIAIQGPRAQSVVCDEQLVSSADATAIARMPYYSIVDAQVAGIQLRVARTGYTGEDGFELFVAARDAQSLWRTLLSVGAGQGLIPAGLSARDSLRLEAGMPLYGHELDLTTTPYEAGLGRVVRLDKQDEHGHLIDFVGRAALTSRRHSPAARVLVGLRAAGRRAVRAGDRLVVHPDQSAVQIGQVTSGAPSPTLGYPIAMAYVSPEFSSSGTALHAIVRGRLEQVFVVDLPFYRRSN